MKIMLITLAILAFNVPTHPPRFTMPTHPPRVAFTMPTPPPQAGLAFNVPTHPGPLA